MTFVLPPGMKGLKKETLLIFLIRLTYCLKLPVSPSKKNCFVFFDKTLLRLVKNSFYFILKALFFLQIFRFLSWRFVHVETTAWLERKRLISKFMASQSGQQIITIHILPNISRSKGNQTMTFLQKPCRK